ncbi:adenosylmethionine--8-amino-7-oxononanoate transaminase [Dawidia soli]|uniref:Adenosylmethionine-8-amino-7-oxononanoate aminotransferase n=1 Tax=Dawidia soli TaxID=2782352 RepID=A0AAP2GGE9_9BACT|nr:adenosylmethionine--8-amino-7-oxononanoate transaminase [Dawidia soli]MBT1690532.1 adenosylmethionine--8-amino-7-oxononanoate transaminase [Dawidia soli]
MQKNYNNTGTPDALRAWDKEVIWHPFTPLTGAAEPILITAGEGVYLHTADGRKIIDAVSSWWVNIHGHANPYIARALAEQATTLEHVIFAGFTHAPAIRLAKNLLTILPPGQSRIFFSDNGSTAVEVGIKMAIQYWHNRGVRNRKKVIAIQGAYHGDTFGAMSVGDRSIFTDPFQPYLFDVAFIDFPTAAHEAGVIEQFRKLVAQGDVGAFIYEPLVQGSAGMRIYTPAVLDALLAEAKAHDVICIADEVFTGFGRTGKLFASEYCQHQPDIVAISKGITGGTMALGVTSCSDKIVQAFQTDDFLKTFFHGHSYTANPITCAAANASFDLLTDPDCRQRIDRISRQHEAFATHIRKHPAVLEARSLGTILRVELQTEEGTAYANSLRKKIYPYFLERNILLRPLGNILYVLPPYVMTEEALQTVYTAIEEFIQTLPTKASA